MGAYAIDYINKAVNNSNYAGNISFELSKAKYYAPVLSVSTVSTVATDVNSALSLGSVLNVGGKIVARANIATTLFSLLKGGYDNLMEYYNSPEYLELSNEDKEVLRDAVAIAETSQIQQQKTDVLKEDIQAISDGVVYTQGQTLPDVLTKNAKALTQSLNFLTSTLSEQFGLLNNYMMGNLMLQQQFLDIKTHESGLKIDAMEYNRTSQSVKDLDGFEIASLSPREAFHIKNATVAKETTDKNNFQLDDEDIDIVSPLDISSVFGYEKNSEIYKDLYSKLGGVGAI